MPRPKHPARSTRRPRESPDALPNTVGALLAAFDLCATVEGRGRIGAKLVMTGVRDGRIRAALVRMLDDDPLNAAQYLTAYRDRTALRELTVTLDRLLETPIGDCEICAAEHLTALATAIRLLGGSLSDEQRARIDSALDRAAENWIPLGSHCDAAGMPTAYVDRDPRLDPGAPCPCGSAKKYGECHGRGARRLQVH